MRWKCGFAVIVTAGLGAWAAPVQAQTTPWTPGFKPSVTNVKFQGQRNDFPWGVNTGGLEAVWVGVPPPATNGNPIYAWWSGTESFAWVSGNPYRLTVFTSPYHYFFGLGVVSGRYPTAVEVTRYMNYDVQFRTWVAYSLMQVQAGKMTQQQFQQGVARWQAGRPKW